MTEKAHLLLKEAMKQEIALAKSKEGSAEFPQIWKNMIDSYRHLYVSGKMGREDLEELFLNHFVSKIEFYNRFGIAAPELEGSPQQVIAEEYSVTLTTGKERVSFEPFSAEADLMVESQKRLRIKTDKLPLKETKRLNKVTSEWVDVSLFLLDDLAEVDEKLAAQVYSLVMAWEEQSGMSVAKDGTIK